MRQLIMLLLFLLFIRPFAIAQHVGIGTSSPSAGLEVKGLGLGAQQRITDPTSGNSLVLQGGDNANLKITGYNYGTGTAKPLYLGVDGANTIMNVGGGNLGIGTATPGSGLELRGSGLLSQQRITDIISGNSLVLQGGSGFGMKISGYNFSTNTAKPLYLSTDGGNTYINPTAGGVGIGTIVVPGGYAASIGGPVISSGNSTHFVAKTTGGTNSWARYYMQSNSQDWAIGTSENFNGNQVHIIDGTFNQIRFSIQPNNGLIYLSTSTGVGINTSNTAGYALAVNGFIRTKELMVETGWADYVFDKDYKLPKLEEVEKFIKANKHLPNIPSAKEIANNGLAVGDVQRRMMEKIEELTLYIISQDKRIQALQNQVNNISKD